MMAEEIFQEDLADPDAPGLRIVDALQRQGHINHFSSSPFFLVLI